MICAGCALSAGAATVMWVSGRVITWRANTKRARAMAAVEEQYGRGSAAAPGATGESAPHQPNRPVGSRGQAGQLRASPGTS